MFICKKNEDFFLIFLNFTIIGAILDHCDKDVNHLILAVVMYNGYMFFFLPTGAVHNCGCLDRNGLR